MTPAEAGALLTVAAAFDNRKPDADAATAWAAALDGLRFADCRDAIVAHYRASSDWLMPAKVIAEVKRIRAKRIADAGDPTPPPDLNPLETIAWLKDWKRRVGDGDTPDDQAAYGELKPRHMPDLVRALPGPDDDPEPSPAYLAARRGRDTEPETDQPKEGAK